MAAPTNTVTTLNAKGNREDLENVIYRVAPEDAPFTSNIGSVTAKAVYHEWQTETLATPNASNAQLEGDDVGTLDTGNLTTRVGNTNQIFRKTGSVSGTQEAVNSAGRDSDYARQKVLKGIELKRDVEARLIGNYGSVAAESGSTPRAAGGALAWLTSNVDKGTGAATGGFASGTVTAYTPGTGRAPTETMLKSVMAKIFSNGGKASQLYTGAAIKQEFSAFTGIAINRVNQSPNKLASIVGGSDVYVSDFGALSLIPHAYALSAAALIIDPSMWAVATLRPVTSKELSVTGDGMKFALYTEKTLVCRNEKASGMIVDLT